jgi:hypothetical protein
MSLDSLTEEQKASVMELIIMTVKEIREQIAMDIEGTSELWKVKGLNKSRRTQKAFDISAAIARGNHERLTIDTSNNNTDIK